MGHHHMGLDTLCDTTLAACLWELQEAGPTLLLLVPWPQFHGYPAALAAMLLTVLWQQRLSLVLWLHCCGIPFFCCDTTAVPVIVGATTAAQP